MLRSIAIAAFALMLAVPAAQAAQNARQQLDAFAHNLHAIKGDFSQTLTNANGQSGKPSTGTLALEAPREFRWEVNAPYKQLIVADGGHVWMYDPDLEQVTVRRQSAAEAHSPLTVLTDLSQLDHEFTVANLGDKDGLAWLRLKPTDDNPQFEYADLGFAEGQLREMRFRDQLGNTSRIQFSHWQRNVSLPAKLFNFTPPKGADVVGDTGDVPEVHPLGQ
ncbi:outer membrane lipoprotein chaperone LolA [Oleiagrimonas sp. C23AA]|uniref:outer membrane lipoprotein chaperone LolA n=1 Tax=Oleiagrimonas sp. C23AA TaxID=2719047 RepID=UPI00141E3CAE|nr:outer membrane lipoprotein chaperone LolA [Oleiagrimonas sp. C23AA]NII10549.1 outer membrane lipoprotein chaperone LolA [Oleiagrimonas sp. C23AA]